MHQFVEAFRFIAHNGAVAGYPQLPSLLHLTLETLKVGAIGVGISLAIALPLGIGLGHLHRGSFLAINAGNLGRALPSLAVLAIGDAFLGLGLPVVELALVDPRGAPDRHQRLPRDRRRRPRTRRRRPRDGHVRSGPSCAASSCRSRSR